MDRNTYQVGERKYKNEHKTLMVNKGHNAHMLIKDGIGTLPCKLIWLKRQATSEHQPISL